MNYHRSTSNKDIRICLRISKEDHERICSLARAWDCSFSHAVRMILISYITKGGRQ